MQSLETLTPYTAFICFLEYESLDGKKLWSEFKDVSVVPSRIGLKFPLTVFLMWNMEAQKTTQETRILRRDLGRDLWWENNLDS